MYTVTQLVCHIDLVTASVEVATRVYHRSSPQTNMTDCVTVCGGGMQNLKDFVVWRWRPIAS